MIQYCPFCGARLPGHEGQIASCPSCGRALWQIEQSPLPVAPVVWPARPEPAGGNGLAVAAMILGIIDIVPFYGALAAAIALILGTISLATRRQGRGMAIAGIATAASGLLLLAGFTFYGVMARRMTAKAGPMGPGQTMALPLGGRAITRQSMCANNLDVIGTTIAMYKKGHAGNTPPDLQFLVRNHLLPPTILQTPREGPARPGAIDYFYFPRGDDDPIGSFMACDFAGNHPDGRCVLRTGGNVTFLKEEDFQAALPKPENAAFAAALKTAEAQRTR